MSMTHDEMIAVIAHHRDGGEVQYRQKSQTWKDIENGNFRLFNFENEEYRIKPEPLVEYAIYNELNERISFFANKKSEIEKDMTFKQIANPSQKFTIKKFIEEI